MSLRPVWAAALGLFLGALCAVHPLRAQQPAAGYVLGLGEGLPPAGTGDAAAGPVPWLSVATVRSYSCLLPLKVRVDTTRTEVTVHILGVAEVGICPDAIGPATGSARLPGRPGSYRLTVRAGDRVDRYTLRVDSTRLAASPGSATFTRFAPARFQRAPRYSAALYCNIPWKDGTGRDPTRLWVCDAFLRQLRDTLGAREIRFAPRRGEIPFPVRNDLRRADVRYIRFRRPSDFRRADDLLQRFSRDVMEGRTGGMFIELRDWRGTLIRS